MKGFEHSDQISVSYKNPIYPAKSSFKLSSSRKFFYLPKRVKTRLLLPQLYGRSAVFITPGYELLEIRGYSDLFLHPYCPIHSQAQKKFKYLLNECKPTLI